MPRMRWNCDKSGCFNLKQRPKIEVFDDCFGRGCAFGDVDGIMESRGHFLILEWKRPGVELGTAQRLLHVRLTALSPAITTLVVWGDAETMEVESISPIRGGKLGKRIACNLDTLKGWMAEWFARHEREGAA